MRQTDKQDNIQRENRKRLPGFLLLTVLGGVFGLTAGSATNWLAAIIAPEQLARSLTLGLGVAAPYLALLCIAFLIVAWWHLSKARGMFACWDGDDEALPEQMEQRLDWSMLWITMAQFLVFLLLGLCLSLMPLEALSPMIALGLLVFCVVAVLFCVGLQRRVVDLVRRMNPEKQGSVYDVKFRKKWYDSCDEAERRRIGEAAYTAHLATSYSSMILWVLLALVNLFFPIGPLPVLVALVPWGVGQFAYIFHCIRAYRSIPKD